MRIPRSVSLASLVLVATAWAMAMVVAGLWLMSGGGDGVRGAGAGANASPRTAALLAGLLAIGAGQYVFVVVVANRLFPSVSGRSVVWFLIEAPTILVLAALGAVLLARYAGAML